VTLFSSYNLLFIDLKGADTSPLFLLILLLFPIEFSINWENIFGTHLVANSK